MRRADEAIPERLVRLDHAPVGRGELRLRRCLPHRFSGWRQFSLHLMSAAGCSCGPVLWGVFSAGGKGVQPWIDCEYAPQLAFENGATVDLRQRGLEIELFAAVAGILPPDGHAMVAYEGPQHAETHRGIRIRVPVAATELGAVLLAAGFCGGFKDWYFAEGGFEGPVKLQANMPHDAAHQGAVTAAVILELESYLRRQLSELYPDVDARGRQRARALLANLARPSPRLAAAGHGSARLRDSE